MSQSALSFTPQRSARMVFEKWKWDPATAFLETARWLLIVRRVSSGSLSVARRARLTCLSFSPPPSPRDTSFLAGPRTLRTLFYALAAPLKSLLLPPPSALFRNGAWEGQRKETFEKLAMVSILTPSHPLHYWWWLGFLKPQLSLDILPNLDRSSFWNLLRHQISLLRSFCSFHLKRESAHHTHWDHGGKATLGLRIQEGIRIKRTCFFPPESVMY